VINKTIWKKLPPDVQHIMQEEATQRIDTRAFALRETWHKDGLEWNHGARHGPVLVRQSRGLFLPAKTFLAPIRVLLC
jgi:hypothetical protein